VTNGQSSYDPRFAEKIGIPRPNFERHDFFLPFYGIERDERPVTALEFIRKRFQREK
jgi:hypothetical protein